MNAKDTLLKIVNDARGDNLERAEFAFRSLSPERMQQEYGQSGCTCQQILDGYRQDREEWQAAKDLLLSMLAIKEE